MPEKTKPCSIIFPPLATNGTILLQHRADASPRRMKVPFSTKTVEYLLEVKANKTDATFKTYQSMLNRYERSLAAEGQASLTWNVPGPQPNCRPGDATFSSPKCLSRYTPSSLPEDSQRRSAPCLATTSRTRPSA